MSILHDSYTASVGKNSNPAFMQTIVEHDDLPIPKGKHAKLLKLFEDDDASNKVIAQAIQGEPVLTARILGAANSVTYNRGKTISTLPEAIVRLGMLRIKQILLGIAIIDANRKGKLDNSPLDYNSYLKFSLAVAVTADILGRDSEIQHQPGDLFTAGLLSQIVWPALSCTFPKHIISFKEALSSGSSRDDAILECLPAYPSYISAAIIEKIGLPPWMINSVGLHEVDTAEKLSDRVLSARDILKNASNIAQQMHPFYLAYMRNEIIEPTLEIISAYNEWRKIVNL